MAGRFEGKVALISGGARGMGAAHAAAFAAEGAQVVVADILEREAGETAASIGEAARAVRLDVTDESSWAGAVATAESELGRLDILVNNAGVMHFATVTDVDPADFRRVLDINVTGSLLGMRAAAPALARANGGAIVNVSSITGMKGAGNSIAYVASKWAVRGMTKAAAVDLAPDGIRVNSIHPGVIETPMVMRPDHTRDEILERHLPRLLVPRLGEPADVVPLMLFLASDEARYVTGAEFVVDGGWTVR